jgi:hypothetical protein
VYFTGLERARRFLADFYLVKLQFNPVDQEPEDLPAACGFGNRQFFAQTPQVAH